MTIEALIKPEEFKPAVGIVSKYHSHGQPSYSLRLSEAYGKSGHIEFVVGDYGQNTLVSTVSVPLNEWTHVAAVFNADGGKMQLYINGQLSGEKQGATLALNGSPVNIGRDYSSRYFKGFIDNVGIWGKALSGTQINESMTGSVKGDEAGLLAYWNFNQGGETATDLTGNGYKGVIHGAESQLKK